MCMYEESAELSEEMDKNKFLCKFDNFDCWLDAEVAVILPMC